MPARWLSAVTIGWAVALAIACGGSSPQSPIAPTTSTSDAGFSLTCASTSLLVGWNGVETLSCTVSTDGADAEVTLSCGGLPSGATCQVDPAIVRPRPGTPATTVVRATYTEEMPFGQFPLVVSAGQRNTSHTVTVTVQKDADSVSSKCPSGADVAAIDGDLRLFFDADPAPGTFECPAEGGSRNLTHLQAQVYRALGIARRLSFDAPLPWTSDSLYRWIATSVRGIRLGTTSFCCDTANVITVESAPPALGRTGDFAPLGRLLGVIVHEARHSSWGAHYCADGRRDFSLAQGGGPRPGPGAYGVEYYTYFWLANHAQRNFMTAALQGLFNMLASRLCSSTYLCQNTACPL